MMAQNVTNIMYFKVLLPPKMILDMELLANNVTLKVFLHVSKPFKTMKNL